MLPQFIQSVTNGDQCVGIRKTQLFMVNSINVFEWVLGIIEIVSFPLLIKIVLFSQVNLYLTGSLGSHYI